MRDGPSYFQGRSSNFSEEYFFSLSGPEGMDFEMPMFLLLGSLCTTVMSLFRCNCSTPPFRPVSPSVMKRSIPKFERSRPDWLPRILRQVTKKYEVGRFIAKYYKVTGLWLTKNDSYYHAQIVLINTAN